MISEHLFNREHFACQDSALRANFLVPKLELGNQVQDTENTESLILYFLFVRLCLRNKKGNPYINKIVFRGEKRLPFP
jgi:hypothetical protein